MARVIDPLEKPLPATTPDEQDLFRQYGAAMLAGDRRKSEKLAQQCLFGPSLVRLFGVAFSELAELQAAAEGVAQMQTEHDAHEQQLQRLYRLRPTGLAESEEVQARIDTLLTAAAPLRTRLNDARRASVNAYGIRSFLGDLLGPRPTRSYWTALPAESRTIALAAELGIEPGPNSWQMLLRPDPRPKRRRWLRAIGQ